MHDIAPHFGQFDHIELERAHQIAAPTVDRYLEVQSASSPQRRAERTQEEGR